MKKIILVVVGSLVCIYTLLLIPTEKVVDPSVAKRKQFLWNRDSLWLALENKFVKAKHLNPDELQNSIRFNVEKINKILDTIRKLSPPPQDQIYRELENKMFINATLVGGNPSNTKEFIDLFTEVRKVIKDKSVNWDPKDINVRQTLYKIIYGGRAAVEELLLQVGKTQIPALVTCESSKSVTTGANILGVNIHSGDILVSRGGAPTSALIARGSDYPGNFSHIALVYVDEKTNLPYIIESHIERGVAISSIYDYLNDKKLRVMVLRLRNDLDVIKADPQLPHKAALYAYTRAKKNHIEYDFSMDCDDTTKLCCSEVASSAYKKMGIDLWKVVSSVSMFGTARWLTGFGVSHFEFKEPSDLEYDPQLEVAAEWRNPETLYQDHVDNSVVDAIIDWANTGAELNYDWYMLPLARITKLYSSLLNQFGKEGPVPEGMSPESALRHKKFVSIHAQIKLDVEKNAEKFFSENKYGAPYWKMVGFAKESISKIN